MTIGDGIAWATFWVCSTIAWGVWAYARAPKHRHKWKETRRDSIVRVRNGNVIGERVFCVCEGCGQPHSFDI